MYKTILAPLDGSKRAEKILPHIEELGMRFEARIIFLQVVEPVPLVTDAAAPHAVQIGRASCRERVYCEV